MDFQYILSQIFTILMFAVLIASYQLKRRRDILIASIVATLLNGLAYIFLHAWTGLAMCGVSLFRSLYSLWDDKYHGQSKAITARDVVVLVIIFIATIAVTIPTYNGFLSLMSVFAVLAYTFSIWQKNTLVYKAMGIPVAVLWIIYNGFVGSFFGVVLEVFLCAASVYGFVKALRENQNGKRHQKSNR